MFFGGRGVGSGELLVGLEQATAAIVAPLGECLTVPTVYSVTAAGATIQRPGSQVSPTAGSVSAQALRTVSANSVMLGAVSRAA